MNYSSKAAHKMLNLILEKECHLVEAFGNESLSLVQSFWICLINANCFYTDLSGSVPHEESKRKVHANTVYSVLILMKLTGNSYLYKMKHKISR